MSQQQPQLTEVWSLRTSTRERIADYLRVHHAVVGTPPTVREISAALRLGGPGHVAAHLDVLRDQQRL